MESGVGERRRFWLGFNRVIGIGPVRLRTLLDLFGDVESAWNASEESLRSAGLDARSLQGLLEARRTLDLEHELAEVEARGFRLLTWDDEAYPDRLREIAGSPPVLYVWGEVRPEDGLAAAIVGTRRPSAYGLAVANDLATALASNGICVVSGLARGIDAAAHRAALESGGRTLAVLGSGLDQIYPSEHRGLAQWIARSGAVLTDYPLGTAPEAGNFPPRNRIVAGLSVVVTIVEAGEGSGALITADFAIEQGREVFAVPGSIYSRASQGTNRLLRAGARPLVTVEDVLEAMNLDAVMQEQAVQLTLPEDSAEARILQELSGDPIHIDELRARCGLPTAQVSASLAMLELKGRARQVGGMHYVRGREARAAYHVE